MNLYKVRNGHTYTLELLSETAHSYTVLDATGRQFREAKQSQIYRYFTDETEALEYAIEIQRTKIDRLERDLAAEREQLSKLITRLNDGTRHQAE